MFCCRDGVILHSGQPYATTDTVRIPRGHSICPSKFDCKFHQDKMEHETAHVARAYYDGDTKHAAYDLIRFGFVIPYFSAVKKAFFEF